MFAVCKQTILVQPNLSIRAISVDVVVAVAVALRARNSDMKRATEKKEMSISVLR
jgi:hypothetical protein